MPLLPAAFGRGASPEVPWPRRAVPTRSAPASALLVGLSAAALVASATATSSRVADGPVWCPFRRLTGLPCPTCGMTRSWVALLDGHPAESIAHHPLGWALLATAGWLVVRGGWLLAHRRPLPPPGRIVAPRVFWSLVAATAVVGWARLLITAA